MNNCDSNNYCDFQKDINKGKYFERADLAAVRDTVACLSSKRMV